jgi:cleavage and polyadenylation specificity factor subunit 3
MILLQWVATPVNDMYADAVLAAVMQAEMLDTTPPFFPIQSKMDRMHFKVCLDLLHVHQFVYLFSFL